MEELRVEPTHPPEGPGPGQARIGVLGGTFDPFHTGHLIAAQDVVEALSLDQLFLVPAAHPPHKDEEGLTPGSLRMRMIRAVVEDDPRFSVSDVELRRDGVSFTVDTLRAFRDLHPDAQLFLILGADQWRAFGGWRDPWEIARMATLVVMTREGEGAAGDAGFGEAVAPACTEVPVLRIDISSTHIRERVRAGRSIRYLVPEAGRRIIEAAKLYL
ncbi:MAG: nicotinate (nicotinamide) nucleotide adenylyltransferase [Gemmatimonadales bacterium]|nr:MAG: nicotinate (nicotinamide) nucleotide adenylyltransferase [Gemmatimonadales bacterium]